MVATVCLTMIVKNESAIICRMLASVVPHIHAYCICDTGSTDNTVDLIRRFFEGYPHIRGKVVPHPFVNFEYNRTKSLQEAAGMADYALMLDADMVLKVDPTVKSLVPETNKLSYMIFQGSDAFYYANTRLVRNDGQSKYVGATHEYLDVHNPKGEATGDIIARQSVFIEDIGDGGSKADKYTRDIRLLSEDLGKNPTNARSVFYLANSYYGANMFPDAILRYIQRTTMGGFMDEVWYSHYRLGLIYRHMGDHDKAWYHWLQGLTITPNRLEGIYEIIKDCRVASRWSQGEAFLQIAFSRLTNARKEKDKYLFLQNSVYEYDLHYEAVILYYYWYRNQGISNVEHIGALVRQVLDRCPNTALYNTTLTNYLFYKPVAPYLQEEERWPSATLPSSWTQKGYALFDINSIPEMLEVHKTNQWCKHAKRLFSLANNNVLVDLGHNLYLIVSKNAPYTVSRPWTFADPKEQCIATIQPPAGTDDHLFITHVPNDNFVRVYRRLTLYVL